MSDIKWIKISTDIFNNRKIRQIEHMPEGDALIVIWFKLLILAGDTNDGGQVYLTQEIPYTESLLANQFDRPLTLIQLALRTFEQFNMIEIIDDIIHISNWEKYQNIDGMERVREQNRIRKARFDERKRIEKGGNVTGNVTVTPSNAIDIDKEKDIDIYRDTIVSLVHSNPEFEFSDEDPELEELLSDVNKSAPKSVLTKQQQSRFTKFWELYPKKMGRKDAERAWKKINPSEEETNNILLGLKRSIEKDSRFREAQYTPLPATWLNGASWEDEFQDELPNHIEYKPKPTQPKESSYDSDEFMQAALKRTLKKHEDK